MSKAALCSSYREIITKKKEITKEAVSDAADDNKD